MIAIEDKIDSFYQETENSVNCIIEGSDEHLDLILAIKRPLDQLNIKFAALNDYLYQTIGTYSDEQLKDIILPKLRQLMKSCMTLIGSVKTSFLYRDIRQSLKDYTKQFELLRELVHDVQNIRLAKDEDFDSLLSKINEF